MRQRRKILTFKQFVDRQNRMRKQPPQSGNVGDRIGSHQDSTPNQLVPVNKSTIVH